MEMCKCESRGQNQTASADNTQISWCIDPDWDTAVRGGAGDPHRSSREQAQACAALLCAARPAWPSGCAELPVSRSRRVTSASWLQQRSLQAAPAQHQPLRHLCILVRVQQCSQKFSRQQPLGVVFLYKNYLVSLRTKKEELLSTDSICTVYRGKIHPGSI